MESRLRPVADCGLHVPIVLAMHSTLAATSNVNVGDESPFKIRFGLAPQSLIPFLKPWHGEIKRQDKLKPKTFYFIFSLALRQTTPVIPLKYFAIQEVLQTLAASRGRVYLRPFLFL